MTGGDERPGERIVVGALAGAFGVRGEVRLKSFCAEPEAIAAYVPLTTPDGRVFRAVGITGQAPGALVARVEGIATREEAEALKGVPLLAERSRLPPLAVLNAVRAVLNHGAGDILEVAGPGGRVVLLPFTRAAVPLVDLAAGVIVADPPEGSL